MVSSEETRSAPQIQHHKLDTEMRVLPSQMFDLLFS